MIGLHKIISLLIAAIVFLSQLPMEYEGSSYKLSKNLKTDIQNQVVNYVQLDEIDPDLTHLLVLAEDQRFYNHEGFDAIGISRALVVDLKKGELHAGGSTITQQLAKNLFLNGDKTISRKLRELVLAVKLEMAYSKEEILEMYLYVIYFGEGAHGVEEAAKIYFGKSSDDLSLEEAATLVGLIPAPSVFNPIANESVAIEKRDHVLALLSR